MSVFQLVLPVDRVLYKKCYRPNDCNSYVHQLYAYLGRQQLLPPRTYINNHHHHLL